TPAPPVGPALGQHGVNIKAFVDQFNERTKETRGITIPVAITVFSDRSFTFEIKSPPAAVLLKQAAGIPLEKKKGGEVIDPEDKIKATGKYKGFKVTATQKKKSLALPRKTPRQQPQQRPARPLPRLRRRLPPLPRKHRPRPSGQRPWRRPRRKANVPALAARAAKSFAIF